MLPLSISTSANIGIEPIFATADAETTKDLGETITSSSAFKSKALSANSRAVEPLETVDAYLTLKVDEKSQYYNTGDWINHFSYIVLKEGKLSTKKFIK